MITTFNPSSLCLMTPISTRIYTGPSTFASGAKTGHAVAILYLFHLKRAEPPLCLVYETEENTLSHILLQCIRLHARRQSFNRIAPLSGQKTMMWSEAKLNILIC